MPEERTLNTPVGHVEFTVLVNGTELPEGEHLMALTVLHAVNRIAYARLEYQDGSAAAETFPLSNGDQFVPGNTIEIQAGSVDDKQTLFKGIIVKHNIRIKNNSAPRLIVECRHKAFLMHGKPVNKVFQDSADSDILEQLCQPYSFETFELQGDTPQTHESIVQYYTSDWDMLVMRAEANGMYVCTLPDGVHIARPDPGAAADISLHYGDTLLELHAEMDAQRMYDPITATAWDPANQEQKQEEARVNLEEAGNLHHQDLSGVRPDPAYDLQHAAALESAELKSYADAFRQKTILSRLRGTARCEGIATPFPGKVVALSGVGDRFSGKLYLSGVKHDFDLVQGWKTTLQFGDTQDWHAAVFELATHDNYPLQPVINGLQTAVVTALESDPAGEFRVQVRVPAAGNDGIWARMSLADAGKERGLYFRPEIGDEVIVGFIQNDPRYAVVLGMLHSSKLVSPEEPADANNIKGLVTRSKMKWLFDDEKKEISISTEAGNRVVISEDQQAINIEDQNGNKVQLNSSGISLQSNADIMIEAMGDIKISGKKIEISAQTDTKVEGLTGIEVSSSGVAKLKGSLVNIN